MRKFVGTSNTREKADFATSVAQLNSNSPIAEDSFLTTLFAKLIAFLDSLFIQLNANWSTPELRQKDDLCDLDIRAVYYYINSECMRRPSERQQSALAVKEVADRYGINIVRLPMGEERAACKALISDLRDEALKTHVARLPELTGLIDNMDESNNDYYVTSDKISEQMQDKLKPASQIAEELRTMINNDLIPYIDVMAKINPDKYGLYAGKLSNIIDNANQTVTTRINALQRKKKESIAE